MVFMELSSQVHARLWATSLCKRIPCHGVSLFGRRAFREKITETFVRFSAMPLFLCCALLSVPTSTSHLLSDTASVEQAALSSLYVPFMCCFAWFVC
jgi:hypothetical protein